MLIRDIKRVEPKKMINVFYNTINLIKIKKNLFFTLINNLIWTANL